MRRIVIALAVIALLHDTASANGPEDLFGASSRVNAMGGAGTASTRDGFSAYYNPSALTRCADSHVVSDLRHTFYDLDTDRTGADAPAGAVRPLDDETRIGLAGCLRLPRNFALGISVASGLENMTTMRLASPNDTPNFALYGEQLQYLSINTAVAFRPIDELSVGFGAAFLVNSTLGVSTYVPVLQMNPDGTFQDIGFNVGYRMAPTVAPYLGVLVEPNDRVRLGATFRGELSHDLSMPVSITAIFLGFTLPVPIQLDATTWFSPRSLSLGGEVDILDELSVTADVTWYDYGALANSPYPYLQIREIPGVNGSALGLLGVPVADAPGFRSSWAIRFGGEARLLDGRLAVRGGYGVRTSALPKPGNRNTTLLDGTVHTISIGGGYAFGRNWTDDSEPVDADEDGIRYEGDEDTSERNFRLDAFARVSLMPEQHDAQKDLRYGGAMFDIGGSFTFGWR